MHSRLRSTGRHFVALSMVSALLVTAGCGGERPAEAADRPDLSGYWMLDGRAEPDPVLMEQIAPNTAVLDDTGAVEFPRGEYGGLQVKAHALEAASQWDPEDDMTVANACKRPSIVYATQGPFPIEIHQGTEFIIFQMEYFDMVRIVFMDGRAHPGPEMPHSKTGFSTGRWEGSTLVVETTHLEPATITNNGLEHSERIRVIERFRLSEDGKMLLSTMEFEDPEVLDNRGARFIAWRLEPGEHVYPYDCDPSFAINYQEEK